MFYLIVSPGFFNPAVNCHGPVRSRWRAVLKAHWHVFLNPHAAVKIATAPNTDPRITCVHEPPCVLHSTP